MVTSSFLFDLSKATTLLWKKFLDCFGLKIERISKNTLVNPISGLIQHWRKQQKIEDKKIFVFLTLDEPQMSGELKKLKDYLRALISTESVYFVRLLSSLSPKHILTFRNEPFVSDNILQSDSQTKYSFTHLDRFRDQKLMEMAKEQEEKYGKLVYVLFLATNGHPRSVERICTNLVRVRSSLSEVSVLELMKIEMPLSSLWYKDCHKWIFYPVLQLCCTWREEISSSDICPIEKCLLAGLLKEERRFMCGEIITSTSIVFLWSFIKSSKDVSDVNLLQLFTLLEQLVEKACFINAKNFEVYCADYFCLQIGCRAFLYDSKSHCTETKKRTMEAIKSQKSCSIGQLFNETLKIGEHFKTERNDVLELEILLVNEKGEKLIPVVDVDANRPKEEKSEKQPNRSLEERFLKKGETNAKKEELCEYVYYIPPKENEKGIDGFIVLRTKEDKILYLLFQKKFRGENTKRIAHTSDSDVIKALEHIKKHQEDLQPCLERKNWPGKSLLFFCAIKLIFKRKKKQ